MNPTDKSCWATCASCYRCADKGRYSACASCSGRSDPKHQTPPDTDDYCDCRNGVLRWRTRNGRLIIAKIPGNPFGGKAVTQPETTDERDWNMFLKQEREKRNDPNWDPIQVYDRSR